MWLDDDDKVIIAIGSTPLWHVGFPTARCPSESLYTREHAWRLASLRTRRRFVSPGAKFVASMLTMIDDVGNTDKRRCLPECRK